MTALNLSVYLLRPGILLIVDIESSKLVFHLNKEIISMTPKSLKEIEAYELTLWKPKEDIPIIPPKTLAERIGNQFPGQELSQFAEELDLADLVAEVWPEPPNLKHLHIIVELPSDRAPSQLLPGTPPAETRDLWPAVTINAIARGAFGGLAAVERNRIVELRGTKPDVLKEFRTKLQQRRWIESDTVCVIQSHTTHQGEPPVIIVR